ncbi:MAG TPA: His-Xaa-Ser system protein HxsD [Pyrinomonadaceae bacterium]|nr:His-Xaa-Ser system protein HxsD [Pyrinomonadaceae bacterium]
MTTAIATWIHESSECTLTIFVDTKIYSLEVLFRTCYSFTDRCYLFLEPSNDSQIIAVRFANKSSDGTLSTTAAEFSNELVNQRVRFDIANETRSIRELIVAQAFAEADLLDRSDSDADYVDDPRGINTRK